MSSRLAARLCRLAGADPEAIPAWIEVGRERRANANRPPFSAPDYRRPGRPQKNVIADLAAFDPAPSPDADECIAGQVN